jgi:hypothetical protein
MYIIIDALYENANLIITSERATISDKLVSFAHYKRKQLDQDTWVVRDNDEFQSKSANLALTVIDLRHMSMAEFLNFE